MLDCVPQSLSTRPPFLCLPIRLLFSIPYSRTFFFQVPIRLRSIWHKIVIVGLALEPSAVVEKLSRFFCRYVPVFPLRPKREVSRDPRSVKKRESEREIEKKRHKTSSSLRQRYVHNKN
jgi:hypothetical protein